MNPYTEEQKPEGIVYRFASGHVLATNVKTGGGFIVFPISAGCGPVAGPIRNYGDAFFAISKSEPLPPHCKSW